MPMHVTYLFNNLRSGLIMCVCVVQYVTYGNSGCGLETGARSQVVSWLPGNPPFASWSWERSRWASGARSRQRTTCVITNRRSDSVEKNSYERNNKPDRRTM